VLVTLAASDSGEQNKTDSATFNNQESLCNYSFTASPSSFLKHTMYF